MRAGALAGVPFKAFDGGGIGGGIAGHVGVWPVGTRKGGGVGLFGPDGYGDGLRGDDPSPPEKIWWDPRTDRELRDQKTEYHRQYAAGQRERTIEAIREAAEGQRGSDEYETSGSSDYWEPVIPRQPSSALDTVLGLLFGVAGGLALFPYGYLLGAFGAQGNGAAGYYLFFCALFAAGAWLGVMAKVLISEGILSAIIAVGGVLLVGWIDVSFFGSAFFASLVQDFRSLK